MKFFKSFYYAGRGVLEIASGLNFRIMLFIGGLVALFARMFCYLTDAKWGVLLLTMGAVLSVEALNTAIERLANKVCREKDELIQNVKDCAAGASLIISVMSVFVGIKILWSDGLFGRVARFFSDPIRALLAVVIVTAAFVIFIVVPEIMIKKDNSDDE